MKGPSLENMASSIICPVCSKKLKKNGDDYVCAACGKKYGCVKGIPELIANKSKHKKAEAMYHSSISASYRDLHQLRSYRNRFFHLEALKPILSHSPESAVLELGCGTGFDAIPLLENHHLVVETDIAPGQVAEARKHISREGLDERALFYIADAENLPFESETFDASFIIASLHHLEHPAKALQEMKRCTRRNGYIIIGMEPNSNEWIRMLTVPFSIAKFIAFHTLGRKRLLQSLRRAERYREPTVERTFTRKELIRLLKEAELRILCIRGVWFLCGFAHWAIQLLTKLSSRPWRLNSDIEYFLVHFDNMLSRLPGMNTFCCNWTIHCIKE